MSLLGYLLIWLSEIRTPVSNINSKKSYHLEKKIDLLFCCCFCGPEFIVESFFRGKGRKITHLCVA